MRRIASEDDFLALVDRHFPRRGPGVLLGRGDDAAVVSWPDRVCVTTDVFLEDVHFRRAYFSPEDIGYKALAVNVSDVAAMGGRPVGFVLGLVCPEDAGGEFWDGVLAGMALAGGTWELPLVGGDLSRGAKVGIAITVWGRAGPAGRFLTRGTARPGDVLFTVGELGLARAGLTVLERDGREAAGAYPAAVAAHLRPRARVAEGVLLAGIDGVTGCLDVSDGLARDLPRLLGPDLGAELTVDPASIHPEVAALAAALGRDPVLEWAAGGEDYALLGTVAPEAWGEVAGAVPEARELGRVRRQPGMVLGDRELAGGFDHFGDVCSVLRKPVTVHPQERLSMDLTLRPIGTVRSVILDPETAPRFETVSDYPADLIIDPAYVEGIGDLEVGQEIFVLTWLHLCDRVCLKVHPRGDAKLPMRSVFSTRSPNRPNPIGLHRARITAKKDNVLTVGAMEAINGTPIIDIKPAEGNLPQPDEGK